MSNPWRDLLPTSVELGGIEYEIRSDFRAALDICTALADPELSREEQAAVALEVFYPALADIPPELYQEALERCLWFLGCGETRDEAPPRRLVDWEQDFRHIVAPVNRVLGTEIRALDYLHWWTFVSAYQEIGDCTFAQIVRIRDLQARGKALDKADREWYARNRKLVDFERKYSSAEEDAFKAWGV